MREQILLSAFVAVEGAHAYSAACPSIMTIRKFKNEVDVRRSIRDGEFIGSVFVLTLGAIVSAIIKSPLPFYFAIGTIVIMVSMYEWALRS